MADWFGRIGGIQYVIQPNINVTWTQSWGQHLQISIRCQDHSLTNSSTDWPTMTSHGLPDWTQPYTVFHKYTPLHVLLSVFTTASSTMADQLTPVPAPGFTLIPGFTAQQPETFITKERDTWKWKQCSYTVSRPTSDGKPGNPYLEIVGQSRKEVIFKTVEGRELMRIAKENRLLKAPVYHGISPEGNELWSLVAKSGFSREKWGMKYSSRASNVLTDMHKS
jgi:hypothetical protein